MKIKMMDLWMQIEGIKLIFMRNFSVLDFFRFASRIPLIAQIKLVLTLQIFRVGGHTPGPLSPPPPPPQYFLLFFSLAIPGSAL